ncbi:unnamed protein product [Trichobilharzia regenti]|nr:unnamed protein product [Trichobilharzia regenti]
MRSILRTSQPSVHTLPVLLRKIDIRDIGLRSN